MDHGWSQPSRLSKKKDVGHVVAKAQGGSAMSLEQRLSDMALV